MMGAHTMPGGVTPYPLQVPVGWQGSVPDGRTEEHLRQDEAREESTANPALAANPAPKRGFSTNWVVWWEKLWCLQQSCGSAAKLGTEFHFEGLKVPPAFPNVTNAVFYNGLGCPLLA